MFHTKLGMVTAGLILAAMAAGGCNQDQIDKLKKENTELSDQNRELGSQNKELKDAIAAANARESENAAKINEMQGREGELAKKDAEIAGLKQRLAERTPATPTATDWKTSTFGDSITVGADILFDSGKAALKPEGRRHLDKIVKDIKTTYAGKPVRVYGHTDTDPINKSRDKWFDNLDLSANRAMAVTRYLIDKGVNKMLIETIAMSEFHPEGKDKAKNRRVEIFVVKASPGKTASE